MRALPLTALAMGAFGIGVTEFAPMGLLRLIAGDLKVPIPTAGLLVTAYALGVMIGAPLVTLATVHVPRKALLIALMGVFTVGNLLAAISSNYGMLLAARLVTSLCHGAFFGVGSVVAADLVPSRDRASAIAFMFMGLTIANVGGVPLAAWVGEAIGWRSAFWGIAGLGLVAMMTLALALPATRKCGAVNVRAELLVLRRPAVLAALSLTALGAGAMFTVFTYIAPIVRDEMHGSANLLTAMLVIYGVGLTIGNWLGGRYADRSLDVTLLTVLSALTVLLLVFAGVMDWMIPAALSILAWGIATFALVPPLQLKVLTAASDAPSLASAMNIGAFNLGNALGAALGGAVIALKLGYHAIPIAGAVLAALGLLLALATRMLIPLPVTHEHQT
jgi:MFS transporter, DHA1 family, inner membrane transport protein